MAPNHKHNNWLNNLAIWYVYMLALAERVGSTLDVVG